MSEAAIREQIYTILSGIADIGKVHDYERWAGDWGAFLALFKDLASSRILGWEIGRKAPCGDSDKDHGSIRTHTFFIRGYMGVQDLEASEKTFNTFIETICGAFREKKDLNGAAIGSEYLEIKKLDARLFGGVLCHFVEMLLVVYEHLA